VFNGIDLTMQARLPNGVQIQGGVATGSSVTDTCAFNDKPQIGALAIGGFANRPRTDDYCRVDPSWASQTQVKFSAIYPLPWDLRASIIYQNTPGIALQASLVVPNAQIAPVLGRNLGSCRGAAVCNAQVTVDIIPPNSMFEPRQNQLDLRFSRTFRAGRYSFEPNIDLYNLLNASSVLQLQTRYGQSWLNAQEILPGRLLNIGAIFRF
jgi:hypothetical protein